MRNKIVTVLIALSVGFYSVTYAQQLPPKNYVLKKLIENPKLACDFIRDHYPDVKFCTVIKNNFRIPLHLKRDDGFELDLDPTISAVLFERNEIEKRFFSITTDNDNKIVYTESKNNAGIQCVAAKDKKTFSCLPWS